MPAVKTLTECSMRAILSNMDAVASLGTLPYRLAKPILMLMTPEKLTEIERNSPHLKEDDQEIWQNLCVQRFGLKPEGDDVKSPKSWRKFYHTEVVRLQQLEDDAGERARNRYKAATAEKQVRSLVFNPVATPMKRPAVKGWGRGATAPKTLFNKARVDTRRKQTVVYTASAKPSLPLSSPAAGAAMLVQAPTRVINVTTTVKVPSVSAVPRTQACYSDSTPMSPPAPVIGAKRPLPQGSPPPPPAVRPFLTSLSPPPAYNDSTPDASSPPPSYTHSHGTLPTKRPRGGIDALFMPKHAATTTRTLPSKAR